MPGENATQSTPSNRGANGQRGQGGRQKKTARKPAGSDTGNANVQEELARVLAELEATKKKLEEQNARGAANAVVPDPVERLVRPKGKARDSKNGFNLQEAMGLEEDREQYDAILRSIHTNVVRANVDITIDFRRQDPAKLAAVYKLTREEFPYLTRARFPLDWAIAEMTMQFLRNRRRYGLKCKRIPNREARKRAEASGGNKRRRRPWRG
ncbi:hypothetical protein B0H16DRAFT_1884344 [Mycena metata]|uniref:Uncharacterized protein n=1 Tax=Mycena metata TaxID=1033252 RepID=A0AAD7NGI0_9AGAR|nr:hypothetical protein B0H16DRAFT_1884344 [Mycena metata]